MTNPKLTTDPNWYGDFATQADLGVPAQDVAANLTIADVIGNKTDTIAGTSLVALIRIIIAELALATPDAIANATFADVIGNKEDAGALTLDTASMLALARKAAKEAWEVEHHFHNADMGFGLAAAPAGETHRADRIGNGVAATEAAPFVLDAGNDDWGAWTQVMGSTDTPPTEIPTATHYDLNEITVVATEDEDQRYMWQMAIQEDAPADDPGVGDYFTEGEFFIQAAAVQGSPVLPTRIFRSYRRPTATKAWMRLRAPNQDTSTASFYLYGHFYIDPDV